jgi:hypothetical protein
VLAAPAGALTTARRDLEPFRGQLPAAATPSPSAISVISALSGRTEVSEGVVKRASSTVPGCEGFEDRESMVAETMMKIIYSQSGTVRERAGNQGFLRASGQWSLVLSS